MVSTDQHANSLSIQVTASVNMVLVQCSSYHWCISHWCLSHWCISHLHCFDSFLTPFLTHSVTGSPIFNSK